MKNVSTVTIIKYLKSNYKHSSGLFSADKPAYTTMFYFKQTFIIYL